MEYEDMVALEQERLKAEWTRDLEQAQRAEEAALRAKEDERKAKEKRKRRSNACARS